MRWGSTGLAHFAAGLQRVFKSGASSRLRSRPRCCSIIDHYGASKALSAKAVSRAAVDLAAKSVIDRQRSTDSSPLLSAQEH
jgi:hypothetical protein